VIAYASAGDFARFNPHLHAIFLEGGFDREGKFLHVPSLDLAKLSQYFRSSMVACFLKHSLLNERLARNMLGWTHRGFSVDLSVKIAATSSKAREALAHYRARPPVSMKKMLVEEHAGSVLYMLAPEGWQKDHQPQPAPPLGRQPFRQKRRETGSDCSQRCMRRIS
jgi:hypothetical protein